MKLNALIADDEPLARERLRFLLSVDEEIAVTRECRNGREVVTALRENRYDVLFLDIQMPGASGFEIIEQVGLAHMPITVFVTAHNHYAVKAFEVHALDYLTKPVEAGRLKAALVRVKEQIASQAAVMTHEQLKSVLAALRDGDAGLRQYPKRLVVPNGTRIHSSM
jgi:two-component system LytT family response regulator